MDSDTGLYSRNAIPRLSRLPMPRASQENLKLARSTTAPSLQQNTLVRPPQLPQPSRSYTSRIAPPTALSESINSSLKSRHGWNEQSTRSRNRSPVREALQTAQVASIERTPPTSFGNIPVFEEGDENPTDEFNTIDKKPISTAEYVNKDKRRPRLSLSERTIETLSQLPPSPSPRSRRSSLFSNDSSMAPPARPASSMRSGRPISPSKSRPTSPTKQPFRVPGHTSPGNEKPETQVVPSPGSLYSPPQAFMRDRASGVSRTLRGSRKVSNAASLGVVEIKPNPTQIKRGSQSVNAKLGESRKSEISKASSQKQPLASISKDSVGFPKDNNGSSRSNDDLNANLLRPKSRTQKSTNAQAQLKSTKISQQNAPSVKESPLIGNPVAKSDRNSDRSSEALRQTIAKARSAHRERTSSSKDDMSLFSTSNPRFDDDLLPLKPSTSLLKKRVQDAAVSGHLNIAAMNLVQIPHEVSKMYESDTGTSNWSEMVDLAKFNAADNRIQVIDDNTFPDWSASELEEDEDKSNQFGGLELFDMHNNLLKDIPVGIRRLGRLAVLNLNGNKLSNHVLQTINQLSSLKELHLAKNNLSRSLDLEDANFTDLQILDLHDNTIEQIQGISHLENLQRINVSNNALRMLPWCNLARCPLIDINISRNQFTAVLFENVNAGFDKLRSLDASYNTIEAMSDSKFTFVSLQLLTVDGNKLTHLPDMELMPSLLTLTASENQLGGFPLAFWGSQLLKTADFSHNLIKLVDSRIAKMENLTSLDLSGNPLRDRKYLTMNTEDLRLDLEKRLKLVDNSSTQKDPSMNDPTRIPSDNATRSGITGVNSDMRIFKPVNGLLDLSSRNLSTVNLEDVDLSSSSSINTIRLSNNDLSTLPYELLSHPSIQDSLRSLDLCHNPQLHPTSYLQQEIILPKLQSLYIVSTGLTSFDALTTYLKAPELREINISCHRLTGQVPHVRTYFPACTTLLATDNWFSSVDVEGVRGLEILDVRNNEIESLPPKIGLLGNHTGKVEPGRLRVLEVSGNLFRVPRISIIEKGTEAVLKDLRRMVPSNEVGGEWKDEI